MTGAHFPLALRLGNYNFEQASDQRPLASAGLQ